MARSSTIGVAVRGAEMLLRGKTVSPRLDAEVLLGSLLKRSRTYLIAHGDDPLVAKTSRLFSAFVRRRAEGVPVPYLTGTAEFYGRPFAVTPAVMVPRPESEAIVGETLHLAETIGSRKPTIADIGTGSGVLAVSIVLEASRAHVVATDISEAALAMARRNARWHRVATRMSFIKSDLLTEIPPELAPALIVANLPYLTDDELKHAGGSLDTRGLTFEPQKALDGGPDGLFVIRRFFAQLRRWPHRELLHALILEHSPAQRRRILELAHDSLPTFRPHEMTPFVTSWTRLE